MTKSEQALRQAAKCQRSQYINSRTARNAQRRGDLGQARLHQELAAKAYQDAQDALRLARSLGEGQGWHPAVKRFWGIVERLASLRPSTAELEIVFPLLDGAVNKLTTNCCEG